ncbi:MAG TPA: VOC family protein [Opitutales bacterium]|jgi:predicted enzyme related to lactoylglutathione lyase|nr:VOC family protein [Opitutales bacterium]
MSKSKKKAPANIIWFEIPADKPARAQKFYSKLFGWKINAMPGMDDYWHIDTGGDDGMPDGGMMTRKCPGQPITNYVRVPSVTKATAQVKKLGGKICVPKTTVPNMGHFAVCLDTEKNMFALWEIDMKGK